MEAPLSHDALAPESSIQAPHVVRRKQGRSEVRPIRGVLWGNYDPLVEITRQRPVEFYNVAGGFRIGLEPKLLRFVLVEPSHRLATRRLKGPNVDDGRGRLICHGNVVRSQGPRRAHARLADHTMPIGVWLTRVSTSQHLKQHYADYNYKSHVTLLSHGRSNGERGSRCSASPFR